jgi:signal transduction histidine kinase
VQDATATARESVEAFQPLASARGLSLDLEIREPTLMATFDHERVIQVLANLLSNAINWKLCSSDSGKPAAKTGVG